MRWLFPHISSYISTQHRGLIVPSKEKKKEKRSSLIRKLGRSKTGSVVSQSQNAPGLVGLLETMRVQMEVYEKFFVWSGSCYIQQLAIMLAYAILSREGLLYANENAPEFFDC